MKKADLTKFIPPDKSGVIRQLLFSLLTLDKVEVSLVHPLSFDIEAAVEAIPLFGKKVVKKKNGVLISGAALKPDRVVNCRNSATMLRLLMGISILKGWKVLFTGDTSLLNRDHSDFVKAAQLYRAEIIIDKDIITIIPSFETPPVKTELSKQSAQLKGFHILCMLKSGGELSYRSKTRNSTEYLLSVMGGKISDKENTIHVTPAKELKGYSLPLYRDPSSAFIAGCVSVIAGIDFKISSLTPEELRMEPFRFLNNCGTITDINEKKNGFSVQSRNGGIFSNGTLNIPEDAVPSIIDEVPFMAYMAARSKLPFFLPDGEWLRNKESDRVEETKKRIGAVFETIDYHSGFAVIPELKKRASFSMPHSDDHRMEMLSAVIALDRNISFQPDEPVVSISFPLFCKMVQFIKEKTEERTNLFIVDHRKKIDRIDDKIVKLLSERMGIASEIIEFKKDYGIKISDVSREKEIISRLSRHDRSISDLVNDLYRRIFSWIKKED